MDKSGSSSKTETEHIVKLDTKKIFRVIDLVLFNIDNHENDILAVVYEKKNNWI